MSELTRRAFLNPIVAPVLSKASAQSIPLNQTDQSATQLSSHVLHYAGRIGAGTLSKFYNGTVQSGDLEPAAQAQKLMAHYFSDNGVDDAAKAVASQLDPKSVTIEDTSTRVARIASFLQPYGVPFNLVDADIRGHSTVVDETQIGNQLGLIASNGLSQFYFDGAILTRAHARRMRKSTIASIKRSEIRDAVFRTRDGMPTDQNRTLAVLESSQVSVGSPKFENVNIGVCHYLPSDFCTNTNYETSPVAIAAVMAVLCGLLGLGSAVVGGYLGLACLANAQDWVLAGVIAGDVMGLLWEHCCDHS